MNMAKDKFIPILPAWVGWVGVFTTGLALVAYAYLGTFSRYYADDFCMSGLVVRHGFWSGQWIQYSTWSNRFAGMFTLAVSDFLGPSFVRVWTALALLLWVIVLTYALGQISRLLRLVAPKWLLLLFAEWIIFSTILLAPEVYQTIFWRVGIITYTLPLVFLAVLAGLIAQGYLRAVNGKKVVGYAAGTGLLAFFAGGFSETYLALQTSTLVILLVIFLMRKPGEAFWRSANMPVLSAVAGSLLSLLIVLSAPGNAIRQAAMPVPPDLFSLAKMSVVGAFLFLYMTVKYSAFQWIMTLLGSLLVVYTCFTGVIGNSIRLRPSYLIFGLFIVPIVSYFGLIVIMTPPAYAQSSYPDGRVLITAAFILSLMFIVEGSLLGLIFSQLHHWAQETPPPYLRLMSALLFLAVFLYPLYDGYKSFRLVPEYHAHAVAWDERDASIRQAMLNGENSIMAVSLVAPAGMSELRGDPRNWVNACMAMFYDVKSIIAAP